MKLQGQVSSGAVYWADHYSEVPVHVRETKLIFTVTLDGHEFNAALDSGATTTIVTWEAARWLGLDSATLSLAANGAAEGVGGSAVQTFLHQFRELRIGGEIIREPVLTVSEIDLQNRADMLLGADFLRAHRVYVAPSDEKIYFTWNGRTDFARPPH